MITRRDAILSSFGLLVSSSEITFVEHEDDQILYVLRHPNGTCFIDDGEIPCSEIARTLVENMQSGSRICLPGDLDHEGHWKWDLKIFDLRRGKTEEISDSLKSIPCERTKA